MDNRKITALEFVIKVEGSELEQLLAASHQTGSTPEEVVASSIVFCLNTFTDNKVDASRQNPAPLRGFHFPDITLN